MYCVSTTFVRCSNILWANISLFHCTISWRYLTFTKTKVKNIQCVLYLLIVEYWISRLLISIPKGWCVLEFYSFNSRKNKLKRNLHTPIEEKHVISFNEKKVNFLQVQRKQFTNQPFLELYLKSILNNN